MLILLGILILIYNLGLGVYVSLGVEPSPTFEFLYSSAFLCGVVWWLKAEAGKHAVKGVYCPGLLVGVGWLVIIPYVLLKTRGVRGLIPILALLGTLVAAYLLSIFIYLAFSNESLVSTHLGIDT